MTLRYTLADEPEPQTQTLDLADLPDDISQPEVEPARCSFGIARRDDSGEQWHVFALLSLDLRAMVEWESTLRAPEFAGRYRLLMAPDA